MKIVVYEARPDEYQDLHYQAKQLKLQLDITDEIPSPGNSSRVTGCDGISILGQGKIDRELLDIYQRSGVKYISTRTIGYNHIDIAYAEKIGIRICNACYPPNGVADFTVMMMLMCLRHYKQALWRGQVNDFSLAGLQGREMKDLTVGVVGTGKIGGQVIQNLSGFGCRILAHGHKENPSAARLAEYTDMDRLLAESDIISLHVPLLESNRHMINRDTIRKMKDGVILINCSRGELADMEALIEGIESEKIGALGIDTS